jgi:hypothetical protein
MAITEPNRPHTSMLYQTASLSTFRVGQEVTYFNAALQCWVSATIKGFNPDGSMTLEEPGQTFLQVPQVEYSFECSKKT